VVVWVWVRAGNVGSGAEDPGRRGQPHWRWSGRECSSAPVVNTWRALEAQTTATATSGPTGGQRVEAPAPLVALAASGQKYPRKARAAHQSAGPDVQCPPMGLSVWWWLVSPFIVGRPAGLCAAKMYHFLPYKIYWWF
jgi:hypothetical protein